MAVRFENGRHENNVLVQTKRIVRGCLGLSNHEITVALETQYKYNILGWFQNQQGTLKMRRGYRRTTRRPT